MKIFLDSADFAVINKFLPTGLVDGITTNPSLLAKQGGDIKDTLRKILAAVPGHVSIEVVEKAPDAVYAQAVQISKLASNAVVKIPFAFEYLPVVARLASEGVKMNITLIFNVMQAVMVSKLNVTYISPFIGRIDDTGSAGMTLIKDLVTIKKNYSFATEILAASIRNLSHWHEVMLLGADIATLPPQLLEQGGKHPLTEAGIKIFDEDWKKLGKESLLG